MDFVKWATMGNLLKGNGGKKGGMVDQHDRAMLDLKVQRDKLNIYLEKMEDLISKEVANAKLLLQQGKKEKAKLFLKKKRMQETMLERSLNQVLNIEEMINSIEFAKLQTKVFEGLKQGNAALKEIQGQIDLDELDKIMDETQEAAEFQKEMDAILSKAMSAEDDAAVDEELRKIAAEFEQPAVIKDEVKATEMRELQNEAPDVPTDDPVMAARETKKTESETKTKEALKQAVAA